MSNPTPTYLDAFLLKGILDSSGNSLPVRKNIRILGAGVSDNGTLDSTDFVVPPSGTDGQTPIVLGNGPNPNVAIGAAVVQRVTGPTAAFSLGGFSGGGAAGQRLSLVLTFAQICTVLNEDASTTAAGRITTQTGAPVILQPSQRTIDLVYDATSARWILKTIGASRPLPFDVQAYGIVTIDSTAAVNAAVAAAQASGGGIVEFTAGNYPCASSVVLPAGVRYRFHTGATLSPAMGQTITFNGTIDADPAAQIFAGAGTILLGFGSQKRVYPDWWGSGTGAVQAACTAAHAARIGVKLLGHAYKIGAASVGLAIASQFPVLEGSGAPQTDYISTVLGCSGNGVTPIKLQIANTGQLASGQQVYVQGVGGNLAANGLQTITVFDSNHITLNGTTGSGNYTSGGAVADVQGSTLVYEGTGTAISVGISPGVGSTYLFGAELRGFRIQCVDASQYGLYTWFLNAPTIDRVHAFGMSSGAIAGMFEQGSINPTWRKCNVRGEGSQTVASNYCSVGFLSNACTVSNEEDCYWHGCQTGFKNLGSDTAARRSTMENCSNHGYLIDDNGVAKFESCHWEGNGGSVNEGIGYQTAGCTVMVSNPSATLYALGTGNGSIYAFVVSIPGSGGIGTGTPGKLTVRGGQIVGNNLIQSLVPASSMNPATEIECSDVRFAGGIAISSCTGNDQTVVIGIPSTTGLAIGNTVYVVGVEGNTVANGWHRIVNLTSNTITLDVVGNGAYVGGTGQVVYWGVIEASSQSASGEAADWRSVTSEHQKLVKHSFVLKSVPALYNAEIPAAGSTSSITCAIAASGFIVGLEASYYLSGVGTWSAGTIAVTAVQNALSGANNVLATGTLSLPGTASVHRTSLSARCESQDTISAYVVTSAGFAPTGGDLLVDIYTLHGSP